MTPAVALALISMAMAALGDVEPPAAGTAAEPPAVATIVVASGLDDLDVALLAARIDADVAGAGGAPRAMSRALEAKQECLEQAACAQALLRAADAPWLLWVAAVRAGPKLQIDARLLDAAGAVVGGRRLIVDVKSLGKPGVPCVPADVLRPLAGAPAPVAAPPVAPDLAAAEPSGGPSPLMIGGIAVAASGLVVSVVCLAIVPSQLNVLQDPESLGTDKAIAGVAAPSLVAAAIAGVVGGTAGGALMIILSD